MDKIVSKIVALGVPGLILFTAIGATGYAGAAAMTTALAALGPGGMFGGVITLIAASLITDAVSEYGFEKIFGAVIKELYKGGETPEGLIDKIERYPVTKRLKRELKELVYSLEQKDAIIEGGIIDV